MNTMIMEHPVREKRFQRLTHILGNRLPAFNPILSENDQFVLKLTSNPAEVRAAQQLRYRVFKQEQGRMSDCTEAIDRDRYDRHCRHLVVMEKATGRLVGTYRTLSGHGAYFAGNFYSQDEFAIRGLDFIRDELCEVGRSCVDPEFRSGAVVGMLWSALSNLRFRRSTPLDLLHYARRRRPATPKFNYLFGCVSLEETDATAAMALYEYFVQNNLVSDKLFARPRPDFELPPAADANIQQYLRSHEKQLFRSLPPLFKGYIRLGAKICGPPAYDREFGTIDFLIIQDMREIPERYARHFANQ